MTSQVLPDGTLVERQVDGDEVRVVAVASPVPPRGQCASCGSDRGRPAIVAGFPPLTLCRPCFDQLEPPSEGNR